MDRLKRFAPVIALALVLVLGVGQPLQVFANYPSDPGNYIVYLEDYLIDTQQLDGSVVYTYHYDDCWSSGRVYQSDWKVANQTWGRDSVIVGATSLITNFDLAAGPLCSYGNLQYSGVDVKNNYSYFDLTAFAGLDVKSFVVKLSPSLALMDASGSSITATGGTVYFQLYMHKVGGGFDSSSFSSSFYSHSNLKDKSQFFDTVEIDLVDKGEFDLSLYDGFYAYVKFGPYTTDSEACAVLSDDFGCEIQVEIEQSFASTPSVTGPSSSSYYYALNSSASAMTVSCSFDGDYVGTVSYQWYKSSTYSSTEGVLIPGAVSSSYVPSTSALGTSYYYCIVTNTYDGTVSSDTSRVVTVNVVNAPSAPQITQNLSSGTMEYTQGDTASPFVISAINSGDGTLSYQWYKNSTNSTTGGTAISGATKSSYIPSTATVGTKYYYCEVTNSVGTLSESITSNVGAIRVVPPPDPAQAPVINPNLSTITKEYYIGLPAAELKIGASVTDGGTLTYQWYSNTVNSSSGGTLLPGETDRTFTPPTDTLGTMYYYCVVTNTLPDSKATSTTYVASIRVVELPKASAPVISTDLPQDPIVYTQGDAASAIGISARSPDGGVLTYQWFKNVVAENAGGAAIAGADGPSYEPATSEVGTAYYYVVITNSLNDTTASVTSRVATVVVEQDMVPDLIGDVIDGITNLPQAIMDGIVGLFVPNAEAIAAYQNQWSELLASRFGAVYESVMLLDEFAQSIQMQDEQNTVPFPSVTLDLAGVPFTFGGWTVQVVPPGFEFVVEMLKRIVSIVATLAFLNSMRNKFERVLGGG